MFTYDVTVSEGDADLTQSFDVTITIIDPCANPSVTLPNSQYVTYTITDESELMILSP